MLGQPDRNSPGVSAGSGATGTGRFGGRPSLEYQYACNDCAVWARQAGETVAVRVASQFYAREILGRLAGLAAVLAAPTADEEPAAAAAQDLAVARLVWAEPEKRSGRQEALRLGRLARPGAELFVIASGWLAGRLPEWRPGADCPCERPAGPRLAASWLGEAGFTVESVGGFHGPASIAWGYLARAYELAGRPDLADRCRLRLRACYAVRGAQAALAPVVVLRARKTGEGSC